MIMIKRAATNIRQLGKHFASFLFATILASPEPGHLTPIALKLIRPKADGLMLPTPPNMLKNGGTPYNIAWGMRA
jgi:hypothetical protein